jgi:hypothetical protein
MRLPSFRAQSPLKDRKTNPRSDPEADPQGAEIGKRGAEAHKGRIWLKRERKEEKDE